MLKKILVLILAINFFGLSGWADKDVGNGGDPYCAHFSEIAVRLAKAYKKSCLSSDAPQKLCEPVDRFLNNVYEAQVMPNEAIKGPNGEPRLAINDGADTIQLKTSLWQKLVNQNEDREILLITVAHEYAILTKLEVSDNFKTSGAIVRLIKNNNISIDSIFGSLPNKFNYERTYSANELSLDIEGANYWLLDSAVNSNGFCKRQGYEKALSSKSLHAVGSNLFQVDLNSDGQIVNFIRNDTVMSYDYLAEVRCAQPRKHKTFSTGNCPGYGQSLPLRLGFAERTALKDGSVWFENPAWFGFMTYYLKDCSIKSGSNFACWDANSKGRQWWPISAATSPTALCRSLGFAKALASATRSHSIWSDDDYSVEISDQCFLTGFGGTTSQTTTANTSSYRNDYYRYIQCTNY